MTRGRLRCLPMTGVALLCGTASGDLNGVEFSNRRHSAASNFGVPTSLSKEAGDAATSRRNAGVAATIISLPALLRDSSRLRGGWLGVDLIQEIAKAHLTPGGNASGENPGEGDREKGKGGGKVGDGWNSARVEDGVGSEDKGGVNGANERRGEDFGSNSVGSDSNGKEKCEGFSSPYASPSTPQESKQASDDSGSRGKNRGPGRGFAIHERIRSALDHHAFGAAKATMAANGGRDDGSRGGQGEGGRGEAACASARGEGRRRVTATATSAAAAASAASAASGDTNRPMASSPPPSACCASSVSDDGGMSDRSEVGDGQGSGGGDSGRVEAEHVPVIGSWREGERGAWGGATGKMEEEEANRGGVLPGDGEVVDGSLTVGGGGSGDGERDGFEVDKDGDVERGGEAGDAAAAAAAAAAEAAAARTRDEIAFLRELQAMNVEEPPPPEAIPPLGRHARSVVTEAMPMRFVDEVGAHIASALAIATAKALVGAIVHLRGRKRPEKVAFDDVLGCDEAKEEIKQIVDFLVDPSKYDNLGASRPKGILLVGPPGTGKTLIAKACAGEAGVPFLFACGSDFNGIYVGMGVAAVKRLFARARKHRKSIIYIDEIDYIGRSRNSGGRDASGATQDREATLNQLLSEMDGFEGKDGIVVMASTNRKEILDDALLRSGRFDMQVDVERPDRKGRQQLFSKYIAPLKLLDRDTLGDEAPTRLYHAGGVRRFGGRHFGGGAAAAAAAAEREKRAAIREQGLRDDISKELAELTPYMTGADVANVCATAGRIAARARSAAVSREHFSAAVDRVRHGLEKPGKEVPREERERTAVHEAGHAVVGWMLPWCEAVVKVSIVWRGNALGFSQSAMTERLSQIREMVLDNVCMGLAGRAAEEVVFGAVSGGASSDLRAASRELYRAITEEGFGTNTGLLSPGDRYVSEKITAEIDQEVQRILAEQYERALGLIRRHRDKVDALSAALLEHQVVHKSDLEELLGEKVTLESARAEQAAVKAEAQSNKMPKKEEEFIEACGIREEEQPSQHDSSVG